MALGFNNAPVDWDKSRIILSDRSGENFAAGLQSAAQAVTQGITQYQAKQEQKQRDQEAVDVLKLYGPSLGLDTSDDKALLAGVKSVGADTLLKLAGEKQSRDQEEAGAAAALKELGLWNPQMTGRDAVAVLQGEQTKAKLGYLGAQTNLMAAQAAGPAAEAKAQEENLRVLQSLMNSGKEATPQNYFAAGGADPKFAEFLLKMAGKPAFTPTQVTMPDGTVMLQTSPQSFVPSPASRAKTPTAAEQFSVGPQAYTKIGNRFFDTATGQPVMFGASPELAKVQAVAEMDRQGVQAEIGNLRAQIAEDQTALAQGDTRTGLLNYRSREARIQDNLQKLAAAQARLGGSGAAPVQPSVAAPPAAKPQSQLVPMIAPNGARGMIPAEQVQAAEAKGFRRG